MNQLIAVAVVAVLVGSPAMAAGREWPAKRQSSPVVEVAWKAEKAIGDLLRKLKARGSDDAELLVMNIEVDEALVMHDFAAREHSFF